MKQFLLKLFTWWNSQTFGTQVWTRLYGEFVGEDEQGNRYYRTKGGKIDPTLGVERRWEKPHVANMTGTPAAYRPSGSTLASGRRPKATGDYQAWTP